MISILVGLLATPEERGTVFGMLALTSALGALLGGATIGPIADRWGFDTLFIALAVFSLLLPLVTWFLPEIGVPPFNSPFVVAGKPEIGKGWPG